MIEMHTNGRSSHVLCDKDGWAALRSGVEKVELPPGVSYIAGLDVFIDSCPCDTNPKSDAT